MFGGKLAGIFFTDTIPVLNESSCLNRRNRFEPCCLCRKACNYAALTIEAGFPVIDEKKCISCGLCASVCPSEALRLKDYQIFRRLSGDDELRCVKSGGIYCLKALSPALIASIIVMKPDITFVMPCSNCELEGKNSHDNLGTAMKFLDALGVNHNVRIIRDENFESELSRRELMSMLFMWGKNRAGSILEDVIWSSKGDTFFARRFLADNLAGVQGSIEAGIFYDFAVSDECNACGVCGGICPSGAWELSRADGKAALKFDTVKCTGCMLCVKTCPEKAIAMQEKFSWPHDIETKRGFDMLRCRHCGRWFIQSSPEQELCSSCSGRQ